MNILIVNAHPEVQSFCSSLFFTAEAALKEGGHHIETSDLYRMSFNPISARHNFTSVKDPAYFKQQVEEIHAHEVHGYTPDLETEMQKVERCELMIWHFPLWWFSVPAMLKGWYDRVFAMGRFYGMGKFYETGVMQGKKALLTLTTGGPREAYLPGGFNGDINAILRPVQRGMFQFVGFSVLAPQICYGPAHISQEVRLAEIVQYRERLRGIEKEKPIDVGSY